MVSGSTPCSSSAPATRSARAVVLENRKPPVSVSSPTYRARALSGESSHPRALAKSNTSSAVAVAVGVHVRGEGDAQTGLQRLRDLLGAARALRGDRDVVTAHRSTIPWPASKRRLATAAAGRKRLRPAGGRVRVELGANGASRIASCR